MSLLKTIRAQLGLSVTPANNFTLDASADNGTMKLARGNAGATTQDVMTVDAAGAVGIRGTATDNTASAGFVGEYKSAQTLFASPVALTSGATISVASISLPAGDWDVSGHLGIITAATTSVTGLSALLITGEENSGVYYSDAVSSTRLVYPTAVVFNTGANGTPIIAPNTRRLSISTGTNIYLAAYCSFTVSTMSAFGIISARRVR